MKIYICSEVLFLNGSKQTFLLTFSVFFVLKESSNGASTCPLRILNTRLIIFLSLVCMWFKVVLQASAQLVIQYVMCNWTIEMWQFSSLNVTPKGQGKPPGDINLCSLPFFQSRTMPATHISDVKGSFCFVQLQRQATKYIFMA